MLGRRVPPGEAGRHHLDAITRAAEELNQMLHELSDAARIADGRIAASLTIEPAAAADLVERAIAPTRGLVETKNLALTVEVAPELGALACDAERVVRVLAGLFGNAARRTPKGGRLAVRAQAFEGAGVRFSVEDGAPDLAPEERAALFELPAAPPPGAPRRPRAVSPAIAPYVARGVIEAHGGRIWIEGEPGRGSRFVITLPADPTPP
jgi:signal transduction histidine kinase